MTELEFIKGMKMLISIYRADMSDEEIKNWYIRFKDINYKTFYKAISTIKNKYMPNAIELEALCESAIVNESFAILDKMWADGYFKNGTYGELAPEQQARNFDKAMMWLNTGIIPNWFKKDMLKFDTEKILTNNQIRLIEEKV